MVLIPSFLLGFPVLLPDMKPFNFMTDIGKMGRKIRREKGKTETERKRKRKIRRKKKKEQKGKERER